MKTDFKKLWYKVRVLVSPWRWMRIYSTYNETYDNWLWGKLMEDDIKVHHWGDGEVNTCTVKVEGKDVWIENAPYWNGHLGDGDITCSRATALLLEEKCKVLFIANNRTSEEYASKVLGIELGEKK